MKANVFIWLAALYLAVSIIGLKSSQYAETLFMNKGKSGDYKTEWAKIDSLESQGLPKSALEFVEKIYSEAKKENNHNQYLKALIYKMKYKNGTIDDSFEVLLTDLSKEVESAVFPLKQIMHSMLGDMYKMYYENNRWKFYNRTTTVGFQNEDIKTWDLVHLADKIYKNYLLSLENSDSLMQIPVSQFDAVIWKGTKNATIRPTLYEFLSFRAIDFFSENELSVTRPADVFEISDENYFSDYKSFASIKIETTDSMSVYYYAAKLFQNLLRTRIHHPNNDALIDADLARLEFVYQKSVNQNKDDLYLKSLERISKQHEGEARSAEILSTLASFYYTQSSKFNPNDSTTLKFKEFKIKSLELCNRVIIAFPKTDAEATCQNLKNKIEAPSLSFQSEEAIVPDEKTCILLNYSNIQKVYYRIAAVDNNKYQKIKEQYYNGYEFYEKMLKETNVVQSGEKVLPIDADYNNHSVELLLDGLPKGNYFIVFSDNKDFAYNKQSVAYDMLIVTEISYMQRSKSDGTYEFMTLHRKTGEPLKDITAEIWYSKYNYSLRKYNWVSGGKFQSNIDGKIIIPERNSQDYYGYYIEFSRNTDNYRTDRTYYNYNYQQKEETVYRTHFFTDRAIYRPGQTIYFKGIVLEEKGETKKIAVDKEQSIQLYDVNYQLVEEIKLRSNEFGTFSGQFVIPTGLINGQMQIKSINGNKYISVEEYKRPKFEVEILPLNGDYILNQDIEVVGKAKTYAGTSLTDANVTYRIVRQPVWRGWWQRYYYGSSYTEVNIASAKTITDNQGNFKIQFKALPDNSMPDNPFLTFNYSIYVDVTDINGETHSAQKSITVGKVALEADLLVPENIERDLVSQFNISTTNLNGEFVGAEGSVTIKKLKSPEQLFVARNWKPAEKKMYSKEEWDSQYPAYSYNDEENIETWPTEKTIGKFLFNTAVSKIMTLTDVKKWEEGRYLVETESKDKFGNRITNKRYFSVFSEKSAAMPEKKYLWTYKPNKSYEPGESAKFIIGSSAENVNVFTEIEHKNKIILSFWTTINKEKTTIEFPIKEEYRGNVSVHFSFIKDNRFYSFNEVIYVPHTNKMIDIEFETFRNKLFPGEKEEWRLTLKGKKGDKVAAEMMATLYDASLDAFAQNYWGFNVWNSYYSTLNFNSDAFYTTNSSYLGKTAETIPHTYSDYDFFNWYGFSYYGYYYNEGQRGSKNGKHRTMSKAAMPATAQGLLAEESIPETEMAKDAMGGDRDEASDKRDLSDTEKAENKPVSDAPQKAQIRSNFNETAFFYPNLKTNEKGEIVIAFTIPESLTRWKMMGLAHTKDLMHGYIEKELITQKDLMVMPNNPRFFRENDKLIYPVKINNISENDLTGTIKIELFDAISMKNVTEQFLEKNENSEKQFTVKKGSNTLVEWNVKILETIQAVSCRIVAKSGKFSDGEESTIPVLSNRMLVTESMPLSLKGNQTKEYKLDKLIKSSSSKTLKHQKLTLEFTSNPAWYAVQAMPYLMEYPYECAEQVFSRFYANSIAAHVANSSPKIKRVFDSWKNTSDSQALLSNLEKNQELKALLLEETPWVLNAQDENERKKRVGLLFDMNNMSLQLQTALTKLSKMQVSNGGWPWFEGMPDSRHITQHIVNGMGKLDKLGITDIRNKSEIWNMVTNGVKYIDDRIEEDYRLLKKHYSEKEMEKDMIGELQIQYLYARSFFKDIAINSRNKDAYNYYFKQAGKYWLNKSKYMQAMIALAYFRADDKSIPASIVKSLKEFSQTSEELGMFWKDNTSGYYWYQAPIEFQAIMIELFDEVANDQLSVNELKVWLIKQKQTQDWKTTKATVEAVYALLMRGTQWLENDEMVKITMAGKEINPNLMEGVKTEAGTGYFKLSWDKNEINPDMGNIKVSKQSEGVAWGSLYWQYFEQLDKITAHETPLKLTKKLFIEKLTSSGKTIEPISPERKLKIGDRIIVRIELRVDRTMEYVHMKDMRASCLEPVHVVSRYRYQDGLGYYESTKDACVNFFFSYLPKGTYVFEYPLLVSHKGDFSNGITSIQCMYAPEFTSHSEGIRFQVE
jgi:uncharacterized protein YfaS (alpha-2-macroglobulin family)